MYRSDHELILAFQQGKYNAFETLYERAFPKVYRYLLFKCNGNKNLAQDLCSEAFLAAFESLSHFEVDEKSNFSAWMLRIAHHKRVDNIRKTKDELPLQEELVPDTTEPLLEQLEIKAQTQEILSFLDTLGEEKKDIILLRLREELSYEEIAPLLGKSEDACRQLFSRTMKTLCEHFWN